MAARVSPRIRRCLRDEEVRARRAVLLIGRLTAAANARPVDDGFPKRDSRPREHRADSARRERDLNNGRRNRVVREVRPQHLGGHALAKVDGCWRCEICRRRSATQMPFAAQRCPGTAASRWAARAAEIAAGGNEAGGSHRRVANGALIWCYVCGSYATAHAVGLATRCPGRPRPLSTRAQSLRLLMAGRHPKSKAVLRDLPELEVWDAPTSGAMRAARMHAERYGLGGGGWGTGGGCLGHLPRDDGVAADDRGDDDEGGYGKASSAQKRMSALTERVRRRAAERGASGSNAPCPMSSGSLAAAVPTALATLTSTSASSALSSSSSASTTLISAIIGDVSADGVIPPPIKKVRPASRESVNANADHLHQDQKGVESISGPDRQERKYPMPSGGDAQTSQPLKCRRLNGSTTEEQAARYGVTCKSTQREIDRHSRAMQSQAMGRVEGSSHEVKEDSSDAQPPRKLARLDNGRARLDASPSIDLNRHARPNEASAAATRRAALCASLSAPPRSEKYRRMNV